MDRDKLKYESWMNQINPTQSTNFVDPASIDKSMLFDTADEVSVNDYARKYPIYDLREAIEEENNPLPDNKRQGMNKFYKDFVGDIMGPDALARQNDIDEIITNTMKENTPVIPPDNKDSTESNIDQEDKVDITKVDIDEFIRKAFNNNDVLINEYKTKNNDSYLSDDEIIDDDTPPRPKLKIKLTISKKDAEILRKSGVLKKSTVKKPEDTVISKSLNTDEHMIDNEKSKLTIKEATQQTTSDPIEMSHEEYVRGTESLNIPCYRRDTNQSFDMGKYYNPPLNTTVYKTQSLMNNPSCSSTQNPQTGEKQMVNSNNINNGINTKSDIIGKGGSTQNQGSYPNANKVTGNENIQMIGMEFHRLLSTRRNAIPDYLGAGSDRYTYEVHNFTAHPVYLVNGSGHMHTLEPSTLGSIISQYGQDAVEKMLNAFRMSTVPSNINHPKLQEIFNSHAINTVVKVIEVSDSAPQMEILVTDPYLSSGNNNPVLKDYSHTDIKNNMIVTFDRNEAANFANKEGSCVAANLRYRTKDIAESLTYHFLNFSDQDLFIVDGTEAKPIRIKKMTQVQRMSFFRGVHGDRNKLSESGGMVFVKRYPSQNTDSNTDADMFRDMHVVDFISVDVVRKETYQVFFSEMCSGVLVFKDEESAMTAINAKTSKTNTMFGEKSSKMFSDHLGHEKEKEKLEKKYNKMVSLAARIGLGVISIIVVVFKSNITDATKALFGMTATATGTD